MKKRLFYIIMAGIIAISCIACGDKTAKTEAAYYSSYDYDGYYYDEAPAEAMYEEARGASGINASANAKTSSTSTSNSSNNIPDDTARKLIRDANLTVETKEFDELIGSLEAQIASFGGYIESMSQSGNSYNYSSYSKSKRYANVHARIPADRLDDFLGVIDGLGNVTRKNLSTRDVTSTYVDIESRLKVLNTEKESLERIMAAADNTKDMLEVQSRLYDVIEEIESYEARKRTYDSLITYSSVDLSIEEVVELTPPKEETRWEELARRFTSSLGDLGDAVVELGIGIVVALPWLIVFGGIITGIVLAIVLPIRAKNKKRKAKQKKEAEEKAQQKIEAAK